MSDEADRVRAVSEPENPDAVRVMEIEIPAAWDERNNAYRWIDDDGKVRYSREPPKKYVPIAPLSLLARVMGQADEMDG